MTSSVTKAEAAERKFRHLGLACAGCFIGLLLLAVATTSITKTGSESGENRLAAAGDSWIPRRASGQQRLLALGKDDDETPPAPTAAPTAAPTVSPTAAPTSAPTATPTSAPTATPDPGDWVLSTYKQSCTSACGEKTCTESGIKAVDSVDKLKYVGKLLDAGCKYWNPASGAPIPFENGIGGCFFEVSTSTGLCDIDTENKHYFCCCGSNCPTGPM
jgi:hypothetical protein